MTTRLIVKSNAAKVLAALGATGERIVSKVAADVEADAKALAPVDTGKLRNSIGTEKTGPLSRVVYATAEYAVFVEHGTAVQMADPFMGPAADRQAGAIEAYAIAAAKAEGL